MRTAFLLTVFLAIQVTSAFAQTKQPAMLACNGDLAVVRLSKIKAGGTMVGFLDAVAAHKAWYRANGFTDNVIVASRLIVTDKKTGKQKYSNTEVITYHIRPPAIERITRLGDEAWIAYVRQYRENSDIEKEYITCMPKLAP